MPARRSRPPVGRRRRRRALRRTSGVDRTVVVVVGLIAALWALEHVAVTLTILAVVAALAALAVGGRVRRRLRARDTGQLLAADPRRMSPEQFEHYLAALCRRDGCRDVTVVGGKGDLGADVLYTDPSGQRCMIQAKRYGDGNRVGNEHVQIVNGTYRVHGAERAAIVTTSSFTRYAIAFAGRRDVGIALVDWPRLHAWINGQPGAAPWN